MPDFGSNWEDSGEEQPIGSTLLPKHSKMTVEHV